MPNLPCSLTDAKPQIRVAIDAMKEALRAALPDTTFEERERVALEISNVSVRETLEESLQMLSDELEERVFVDDVEYVQHLSGRVKYYSLVGPLSVKRATYREVGVRNGKTVVPMALAAGLVERATPALAYSIALGYTRSDMREHHDCLEAAHRAPPSRATLERMAKAIAASAQSAAPRVEKQLRRIEELPEGAAAISIGLDRTSVPMSELRPEGAPLKKSTRKKPRLRVAPAPIDVNYRMAYVGTVSVVDENGEALTNRRYAIPACDEPSEIAHRMMNDVRAALRENPELNVGVVQDGAHEMWNVVGSAIESLIDDKLIETYHETIDRFHLLERLGHALAIVEPNDAKRARRLDDYRERFDQDDATIDRVERYLRKKYNEQPPSKQKELWEHLVYIKNNRERMRYVSTRNLQLPVGSGVTESAAKTVIAARAKRSGQRWSKKGLRGALSLRALDQSGRLPSFWRRFSRNYTANIKAA
jgi:hypothetical protein